MSRAAESRRHITDRHRPDVSGDGAKTHAAVRMSRHAFRDISFVVGGVYGPSLCRDESPCVSRAIRQPATHGISKSDACVCLAYRLPVCPSTDLPIYAESKGANGGGPGAWSSDRCGGAHSANTQRPRVNWTLGPARGAGAMGADLRAAKRRGGRSPFMGRRLRETAGRPGAGAKGALSS